MMNGVHSYGYTDSLTRNTFLRRTNFYCQIVIRKKIQKKSSKLKLRKIKAPCTYMYADILLLCVFVIQRYLPLNSNM